MEIEPVRLLAASAAILPGLAVTGVAASLLYLDGPPTAHTAGFGEPSCAECHFDNPVDDGAGELRISGLPPEYEPGRSYTITVEVRREDIGRGGFQAAVRFAEGKARGRQAGRVEADGRWASVVEADSIQYVQHTAAGSAVEDGRVRWEFEWTAPTEIAGRVLLHAAGIAANDDDSVFGDYIYLAKAVARARR